MITDTLKALYTRDLGRLKNEISAFESEDRIWYTEGAITNCAGNLCLHLVGNLKAFIGATLNNTGYIRKRDLEFSQKGVSRADMLRMVDETLSTVIDTLDNLSTADLEAEYPQNVFGKPMTTGFFLIHLSTHLGYHLGQINYHRRLLDQRK